MTDWILHATPAAAGTGILGWATMLRLAMSTCIVRVGLLSACLVAWAAQPAHAQLQDRPDPARRVAFVVGNANYQNESPLQNPHADAALLARTLRRDLRFDEVIEYRDMTRRQMVDLVREVRLKSAGSDAVFIYYSGHGMQGPGGNHLIPVDARITYEEHVASEGIAARDLVDAMRSAAPRVAVLVLDACRDSPYARNTKSGSKGLARMDVSGGNLLVAYATAEGTTAADGSPGNSPYAQALARHLKESDKPLLAQFDAVRRTTMRLTGNRQQPTREGDLEVDVHLTAASRSGASPSRLSLEDAAWTLCMTGRTGLPCEEYLANWPDGRYAALARTRMLDLRVTEPGGVPPSIGVSGNTTATTAPSASPAQTVQPASTETVDSGSTRATLGLGQELRWRITDDYTGNSRFVDLKVTRIGAGRVEFNGGLRLEDVAGNRVGANGAVLAGLDQYQPPGGGWQALLASSPGTSIQFDNDDGAVRLARRGEIRVDQVIVGARNLRVQVFDVIGELISTVTVGRPHEVRGTIYIAPDLRRVVKFKIQVKGDSQASSFNKDRRESIELIDIIGSNLDRPGTARADSAPATDNALAPERGASRDADTCSANLAVTLTDGTKSCFNRLRIADKVVAGWQKPLVEVIDRPGYYAVAVGRSTACDGLGVALAALSAQTYQVEQLDSNALNICRSSGCDCMLAVRSGSVLVRSIEPQ